MEHPIFLKKYKGEFIEFIDDNIYKINNYKYGRFSFNLNSLPKCNICGSELRFKLIKNTLIIDKCLNENCPTNNKTLKKGSPIKKEAFIPSIVLDEWHNKLKSHSYFNKEYLINNKGLSEEEAEKFINDKKIKLKEIGKKNKGISVTENLIKKYGYEKAMQLKKESSCLCKEYWIKRGYSVENAINKISDIQKNNAKKVKNYTKVNKQYLKENLKMTDEDIDLFMKEKSIRCKEYWIKRGYSKEEAINKVKEIQSEYSKRRDKEILKITNIHNKIYWINKGYSEEEAIDIISKNQVTFSKETCINKYGIEEGIKIFNLRQKRWQETLHKNGNLHVGYSKISQELFNSLLNFYDNDLKDYIFYGSKNKEYCIRYDDKNYIYDFTDLNHRKIIEFQGDIYHGNPKIFKSDEYPNPFYNISAKEIWDKDEYKKNIAIKNGFDVLIIWENDYRNNKNEIINICKKFLNI